MRRVTLIHWNDDEAKDRLASLKAAGQRPVHSGAPGPGDLAAIFRDPPECFVIDLGRMPSQGRDLALLFRQRKATRHVPIVFVEGDPAKVAKVRELLPDAQYATWRGIRGAMRRAAATAAKTVEPSNVPGVMDGYSGTPLPKKLRIKEGSTVALLGAPTGFEKVLQPMPDGVSLRRQARGKSEIVMLFAANHAELKKRFASAVRALADGGGLWIAWPKQASGKMVDLTQQIVRDHGLSRGLVDYKICSIDPTWSGLLFARRGKP